MALTSMEEERAVLRTRSDIRCFPVAPTKSLHKRTVNTSRAIASAGLLPM
jgi:hypothetical protein